MKCLMKAWNDAEPQLYGWLLKQTGDRHQTEDIMQDVFLKCMRNSERFCSLADSKSWLFRVTRNHFIDDIRRRVDVQELEDVAVPNPIPPVMTQMQSCLPRVLPKLSDNDRHIIESCDLNGMTQLEYANLHGLTLPGAKARLQRARTKLKQQLSCQCQVEHDGNQVSSFKREQVLP